jgi:hypothetical protein
MAPYRHSRPATPVSFRSPSDFNFKFILPFSWPCFFGTHRRLLDSALLRAFDSGRVLEVAESPVVSAMLTLLMTDGMATIAPRVGS